MNSRQIARVRDIAADARKTDSVISACAASGYVLLYPAPGGRWKVSGWARALDRPQTELPGNLAIGVAGDIHVATGGNTRDGGERWTSLVPAPALDVAEAA